MVPCLLLVVEFGIGYPRILLICIDRHKSPGLSTSNGITERLRASPRCLAINDGTGPQDLTAGREIGGCTIIASGRNAYYESQRSLRSFSSASVLVESSA